MGDKGAQGDQGDKGDRGFTGYQGFRGEQGLQGNDGFTGFQGFTGLKGSIGNKGDKGDKGDIGIQGERGFTGFQGFTGAVGDKGETGDRGFTGFQGLKGDSGDRGLEGIKGDTGDKGDQGAQGSDGSFGGATFEYLSDTNSQTEEDPGNRKVRFNNTILNSSTKIYIDSASNVGGSIDSFLQTLENITSSIKGFARFSRKTDNTAFLLFQINDVTDKSGWWILDTTIQTSSSNSPFGNNNEVMVSFLTNGNKGDQGLRLSLIHI